jgi:arylsulfatase A-like enzyme
MTTHLDRTLSALLLMSLLGCQTERPAERPDEVTEEPTTQTNAAVEPPTEPPEPELDPALPVLAGESHGVYDLLVNRPIAHRVERDAEAGASFALDATAPDFMRYIHGNHMDEWVLGVDAGEEKAAAVAGKEATLYVPSWRAGQEAVLRMRVHNPASAAQEVRVYAGKTKLGEVELEPGWSVVGVPIAAERSTHELELRLRFSRTGKYGKNTSGGALAWAEVGAPGRDDTPRLSTAGGQGALELGPGEGLAYYVWALPKSRLGMTIEGEPGCGVEATWSTAEGEEVKKVEAWTRALVEGRGASQRTDVDLSEVAGEAGALGRLEVTALPGCAGGVKLTQAAIGLPGARPEMPTEWEPPKVILFWKADALRADYLPFHEPGHGVEAPAFADVAARGAVFKLGFVEGNESRVSHASMFTGLFPKRHGVHPKGKLKDKQLLLTEALQGAGYTTIGRASNGYVSKTYGYEQGWDAFSNDLKAKLAYKGEHLVRRALKDMKKHEGKPMFVYVGSIDTHVTYRAHKGIIEKYHDGKYDGPYTRAITGMHFRKIWRGEYRPNDADKERAIALYKNEITYNDQAFAQMREGLKEMGLWEDTMVVITADHGDELWEHGKVGHGHNLFQELVHVPLVVSYPKLIPAGTEVWAGADVLDLYPTIMAAVRGERPEGLQGKNLLEDAFKQRGDYPEPATSNDELKYYTQQLQHYKIILRRGTHWFYDRAEDHYEKKSRAGAYPLAERWLLDSVSMHRGYREQWDKSTWGAPTNLKAGALEMMER